MKNYLNDPFSDTQNIISELEPYLKEGKMLTLDKKTLSEVIEKLHEVLHHKDKELAILLKEHDLQGKDFAKARHQLKSQGQIKIALQSDMDVLEEENNALIKERDELKERLTSMQVLEEKNKALLRERDELQETVDSLSDRLERTEEEYKNEVRMMKQALWPQSAARANSQHMYELLEETHAVKKKELAQEKHKLESQHQINAQLQSNMQELEDKCNDLLDQLDLSKAIIELRESDLKEQSLRINDLVDELESTRQTQEKKDKLIKRPQKGLEFQDSEQQTTEHLSQSSGGPHSLEQEALQSDMDVLEEENDALIKQRDELKERLTSMQVLEEENKALLRERDELKKTLDSLSDTQETIEEEYKKETELRRHSRTVQDLSEKLASAKKEQGHVVEQQTIQQVYQSLQEKNRLEREELAQIKNQIELQKIIQKNLQEEKLHAHAQGVTLLESSCEVVFSLSQNNFTQESTSIKKILEKIIEAMLPDINKKVSQPIHFNNIIFEERGKEECTALFPAESGLGTFVRKTLHFPLQFCYKIEGANLTRLEENFEYLADMLWHEFLISGKNPIVQAINITEVIPSSQEAKNICLDVFKKKFKNYKVRLSADYNTSSDNPHTLFYPHLASLSKNSASSENTDEHPKYTRSERVTNRG